MAAMLAGLLIAVPATQAAYMPPPIKRVWVVDLENENFAYTFGASGHEYAPT